MQQLTIFDVTPVEFEAFSIGDTTEVFVNVDEEAVEDYYYLKEFEGMKGQVVKILYTPNLQYELSFGDKARIGIFRHNELINRMK